jgi:hypothetical protein
VKPTLYVPVLTLALGALGSLAACAAADDPAAAVAEAPATGVAFQPTGPNPDLLTVDVRNDCARVESGGQNIGNVDTINFNLDDSGWTVFQDAPSTGIWHRYTFCGLERGHSYNARMQNCGTHGNGCSAWTEIPFQALDNFVSDPGFEGQVDRFNFVSYQKSGSGDFGVDLALGNALRGKNNAFLYARGRGWNQLAQVIYVEPNKDYEFSAWIRENERLNDSYLVVQDGDTDAVIAFQRLYDQWWQSVTGDVDPNGYFRYAVPFHAGKSSSWVKKIKIVVGYTAPSGHDTWMQLDNLYVARTTDMTRRQYSLPWHTDGEWALPWWL